MGKSAAALGLFDGVHLGHRAVLDLALKQAEKGLTPMYFTFFPDAVQHKSSGVGGFIYDHRQKTSLIRGFSDMVSANFSELCSLTGEDFVRLYLRDRMDAAVVCCGADFRFGHRASCGIEELRRFGEKYGFTVMNAEDVCMDGITVSSGEIRRRLLNGDISGANRLLGQPYAIMKEVTMGAQLGRTIGFPTINQVYDEGQLVPRFGVYASRVTVGGITYPAMTNIGMKPTVDYSGLPLAETHIIGFSGDLYGRLLTTELVRFIRPEKKFSSVEELRAQIAEDIENSR